MQSTDDLGFIHKWVPAECAARLDPPIPSGQAEELAALFKSGGADVTISWHQGGRELGDDDIQAAKHWLSRENIRRKVAA